MSESGTHTVLETERHEPLLRVKDLSITFDTARGMVNAVRGASFELAAGQTLGLIGESGSGKSVTGKAIIGLLPEGTANVERGSIWFDGQDLVELPESAMRRLRGQDIAMIFQDPARSLDPTMKVGQQLIEAIRVHDVSISARAAKARALELLDAVHLPDSRRNIDCYPIQLSGGMRQRVMIAIALAGSPRLLVADEPTTSLDVTTQAQILDLLTELRDRLGMAMILITHDLAVAANSADHIAVMHEGLVVEQAPTNDLLTDMKMPYTRRLFEAIPDLDTPLPARSASSEPSAGAELLSPTAVLEVCDVTRVFRAPGGEVTAVDGVSFTLERGQTLGLVGESGSGKSTTARAIVQLPPPTSGTIKLLGKELTSMSGRDLRTARSQIQMVFQDPYGSLNPRWPLHALVTEPLRIQGAGDKKVRRRRADELLDLVGLDPATFRDRRVRQISGGQAQRVAIARALATDPVLVCYDEAVSALDVSVQAQILDLIDRLKVDLGLTSLFISHDLAVVREVSDVVGVMYRGRLVELEPAEKLYRDPGHSYTRALLSAVPRLPRVTAAPG